MLVNNINWSQNLEWLQSYGMDKNQLPVTLFTTEQNRELKGCELAHEYSLAKLSEIQDEIVQNVARTTTNARTSYQDYIEGGVWREKGRIIALARAVKPEIDKLMVAKQLMDNGEFDEARNLAKQAHFSELGVYLIQQPLLRKIKEEKRTAPPTNVSGG